MPPFDREMLEALLRHHAWAGERLIEAASRLTPEQLASDVPSHGGLFETLRHVLDVSWSWRLAAQGEAPPGLLWEVEPLEDLAALRHRWRQEDEALLVLVKALSPDDLGREVTPSWKSRPFRIWEIVLHIVTHRGEHGNELGWALTRLGQSPGELGFLHFVDLERARRLEAPPAAGEPRALESPG